MSIILTESFFASVAMMKLKQSDQVPIAATDGQVVIYNPQFMNSIQDDDLSFILYHEFLHIILMHHFRRGNRDPKLWNVAADIAVNLLIEKTKKWIIPAFAVAMPNRYRFENKTVEEIYDILKKDQQQPEFMEVKQALNQAIEASQQMPLHDNQELSGKSDTSLEAQAKTKQIIEQTIKINEQDSKHSYSAQLSQRIIEEIKHDITSQDYPWYIQLFDQFTSLIQDDYSFQRPNPRYVQHGAYLPINYSNSIRKICFTIDTSGSMDSDQLTRAMSHINDIIQAVSVATIDLIQCDTIIHDIQSLNQSEFQDILSKEFVGRGGTDLTPPFQYYEDNPEESPDVFVYYTDLDAPQPYITPDYPVFWVTDSDRDTRFGSIIRI